jgi:iron complex outermembrane receptor protein
MIERIEVLKDGASSIYGSDAIAGVVNIILKKTMDGRPGQRVRRPERKRRRPEQGLRAQLRRRQRQGRHDVRPFPHRPEGVVWAKDREITAYSFGPNHKSANYGAGPWGRITPLTPGGASNPAGFNQILNHTAARSATAAAAIRATEQLPRLYRRRCGHFNSTSQMMYTSPTRLTNLFTKGSIALPYDMRLTTTAMYSERQSSRQVAGYPLRSDPGEIPGLYRQGQLLQPYGNQGAGIAAGKGQDLFFYRRTTEVPRVTATRTAPCTSTPCWKANSGSGTRPGTGTPATTTARFAAPSTAPAT